MGCDTCEISPLNVSMLMRRFPETSPAFLSYRPPSRASGKGLLDLAIPLALITPMVGGGVEPHTPDDVSPVRLSAVRGQLRQWWRWLHLPAEPGARGEDAALREVTLWGGVLGDKAISSRVRLSVEQVQRGEAIPAGYHKLKNGKLAVLPELEGACVGLDYALFPLQRQKSELQGKTADVPTRLVRATLVFALRVQIEDRPEVAERLNVAPELCADRADEALAALWAWIYFGGLGARTRRGLGALKLNGPVQRLAGVWPMATPGWERLFGPLSREDWTTGANQVLRRSPGSRAAGGELWVGPHARTSAQAHQQLIGKLRTFRQAPGEARAPGKRGPHGRSHWPEPNVLRGLREVATTNPMRWEHAPGSDAVADAEKSDLDTRVMGLPRAAFGLPLEVQFKDDLDKPASASVLPEERKVERLASPLLMRPVQLKDGAYPVLLRLPLELDTKRWRVRVKFKDKSGEPLAPVYRSGGAGRPVSDRLRATKPQGDAVGAFLEWLKNTANFWRVP